MFNSFMKFNKQESLHGCIEISSTKKIIHSLFTIVDKFLKIFQKLAIFHFVIVQFGVCELEK
jgi:hypothetical protein